MKTSNPIPVELGNHNTYLPTKQILPSRTYSMVLSGVPGFKTTPALAPKFFI